MRDEKEERKKQARSNKQTRQSNTAHPRQSLCIFTCRIIAGRQCTLKINTVKTCINDHVYHGYIIHVVYYITVVDILVDNDVSFVFCHIIMESLLVVLGEDRTCICMI